MQGLEFSKLSFTDEFIFRICTRAEKFAFLTLKINVEDVKNSIWLPADIKIQFIFNLKISLEINTKMMRLHISFIFKEVFTISILF